MNETPGTKRWNWKGDRNANLYARWKLLKRDKDSGKFDGSIYQVLSKEFKTTNANVARIIKLMKERIHA